MKRVPEAGLVLLVITLLGWGGANTTDAATVTLDWDSISINTDGTPVTGLRGYRIYQSTVSFQASGAFLSVAQAMADPQIQHVDALLPALSTTATLIDGSTNFFRLVALYDAQSQSQFNVDGFANPTELSLYAPYSRCDVNSSGTLTVHDVQLCANQIIGLTACTTGDINGDGRCVVTDIQRVINAVLGDPCVTQ